MSHFNFHSIFYNSLGRIPIQSKFLVMKNLNREEKQWKVNTVQRFLHSNDQRKKGLIKAKNPSSVGTYL